MLETIRTALRVNLLEPIPLGPSFLLKFPRFSAFDQSPNRPIAQITCLGIITTVLMDVSTFLPRIIITFEARCDLFDLEGLE